MEENASSAHPLNLFEHVIGSEEAPLTPSGLTKSAEITKVSKRSYPMNSNSNSGESTLDHTNDTKRLKPDCTPTNLKENHTTPDIRILGLPADENLRRACLVTCSILESNFKFNEPTGVCNVHFAPHNLNIKIVRKDAGVADEQAAPPNTNGSQNLQPNSKQSASVWHKTDEKWDRGGRQCCIATCGKSYRKNANVRLFSFPSDQNLRRAWLEACGIQESNFKFNLSIGVCDDHFLPQDMGVKRLRRGAIPSQNLPPNCKPSTLVWGEVKVKPVRCGEKCCISTCGRGYRNTPNIRMFTIPLEENLRRAWIEACGIQESNLNICRSIRVCDAHFLPQDMGLQRLRRGPIPSLNLPSSSADKTKSVSSARIKGDGGLALSEEGTLPSTSRTQSLSSENLPIELTNCCISTCGRNKSSHPDIRIFPFPSGIKLRHAWKHACGIPDGLSRASGVCDAHFLPHETSDGLSLSSIPTQNLPPNSKPSTLVWGEVKEKPVRCGEKCCISTCGRGYRNTPNIRMFRIPLEENLRRAWIEACGLQESKLNYYGSIRVCDAHFLPQDMGLQRLRRGPIPSLNLPSSSADKINFGSSAHIKGDGGLALSDEEALPSTSHNLNLPCDDALHPESCNYCLQSQKRGDIFRLRYKSLVRKIAKLKTTLAGKRRKMKHFKSQSNLKLNLDLRRPKDRTRMREILRNTKGLSNSAQVMFLMLMKPIQYWEDEEKELAISLYYKAPFDFYFMTEKLNLHLPSMSSIKHWVRHDQNASIEGTSREWNIEEIGVDLEDPEVDNTWNIEEVYADVYHEEVNGVDIVYEGAECDDVVYEGAECVDIVYEGAECDDIEIKSEIIEIDDVGE